MGNYLLSVTITSRLAIKLNPTDVADHMLLRLHLMEVQCLVISKVLIAHLAIIVLRVLMTLQALLVVEAAGTALEGTREFLAEVS